MNPEIEKALIAISSSISRATGLYRKWAQKNNILYGIVEILYILHFNSAVTQRQISEICEMPKQTVNHVIRQFKKENYIIFVVNDADKRQKQIMLTQNGKEYSQKILGPFFKLNERVANRMGVESIRQLLEGLETFCDAMEIEMDLNEIYSKWDNREKNGLKKE